MSPDRVPPPEQWTIHHCIGHLNGLALILDAAISRAGSYHDREQFGFIAAQVVPLGIALRAIADRQVKGGAL